MAAGFMPSCLRRLLAFLLIFCVPAFFRRGQGISTRPEEQHLYCSPQKYEIGSAYDADVGSLLPNLTEDVIKDGTIYYWKHVGKGGSDPGVSCVAMCYADHSREECAQCLRYVAGRFLQRKDCPNAKVASAFYDACLLWYQHLFPVVRLDYSCVLKNKLGLDLTSSEVAVSFQQKRDWLLRDLSSRAISSEQYAAASSTEYGYGSGAESIYGLVQCQKYLSKDNCTACLDQLILAVGADPAMANKTIGALKGYWCYIRYGTEQFNDYISEYYKASATAPATAPAMAPTTALPPPPHQGRSRSATMIRVIIASCSIVFLTTGIIVLLGCLFRGRIFRALGTEPPRNSIQLGSLAPTQFSVNQLKAATNNFDYRLGSGAFGTVYKGTMGGKEVAVKKLRSKDGVVAAQFASEAGILMAFKHKNLVKLLGYCNRGEDRLLCFEYLSGGSLDKLIYEKVGVLDWSGRYKIVQGICSGLHYLHHELDHEQNIVHLDLKASNVLISRGEGGDITNVKIADFGLSKFFRADLTHSYTEQVVGLKAYMAPELLNKGRISPKADIYSFGVLILEIVTGQCAMKDDSSGDFISWVRSEWSKGDVRALMDPADRRDGDCIAQARNCMEIALDCIQEDPNSRPDAEKIRQRLSQV